MSTKYKVGLVSFLLIAVSMIASACDSGAGDSCELDTDCSSEDLCYEGTCEPLCESQDDCFAGEICVERTDATGSVCLITENNSTENNSTENNSTENNSTENNSTENNSTEIECTVNEDCADLGEDFFCNPDQMCEEIVAPEVNYSVVQILDTSADDGTRTSCSVRDPGSDLMYAYVQDSEGTVVGWANLVDFVEGEADHADGNTHTGALATLFDGSAPGFFGPANECPAEFSGNTVALGCGGYMLVQFLDDDSTPINLTNDHQIVVAEWGSPSCGSDDLEDFYQVNLCTDTESALTQDVSSCTELLGEYNSGINTADVTLP